MSIHCEMGEALSPSQTSDKLFSDFPEESVQLPSDSPGKTFCRKRTSTTKILALLALVTSGITFTAFVVSSRWNSPGRGDMVIDDGGPQLPEGYVEAVLARVFGNHTVHGSAAPKAQLHQKDHQKGDTLKQLSKRAVPDNQICGPDHADDWLGRICDPERGPRAWVEVCHVNANQDLHVQSECGEGTYCVEIRDHDDDDVILCLPDRQSDPDNLEPDPKRRRTTQYGFRTVDASSSVENTQIIETITLKAALTEAFVSGRFVDTSRSYVIAPNNQMNANERGYTLKLCRSASTTDLGGRDCRPKQKWYFSKGDLLDFTFGAAVKQKGIFFYAIDGTV
ncbi:uncharacterized protein IWZ02DRAFT_515534 [Phyllosticta citriasiana]|uniref:uncharacterized protein n=1 Tax=Phyllosticta citriasiana TaxID=595635 RepID=UPI0030FD9871